MAINSYPKIYKLRVVQYYLKNKQTTSIKNILDMFQISNGTLYNWIADYTNNELAEKKKYTKKLKYTPEIKNYIQNYITKN